VEFDALLTGDQRRAVEEFRQRHRTGVLTLLFTDVVGSTELKQRLGDAVAVQMIQRHRSVVRETLRSFEEAEEISTAGDSFFIVFIKPSDAVRFALRLQNTLRSLDGQTGAPVQIRIGVHMGEVFIEEKGEGALERDVLGIQVDTASRVMSLASGGQTLMTRSVFDNARSILKGEALAGLAPLSWLNHGLYSIRGVEEPIEICEVGEEALAPLQPPADTDKARRHVAPDREPVLGWRPAVEQPVPGTEWELEEKLGEGGFGEVWLARHRRTKEVRVFKFCFRADRLRSLKREMTLFRIMKEVLGERNDIARLYDIQFEEAPYYLVLEYTSGGNLAEWIERRGGFDNVPLNLRLEIVAQVATALAAAHSVGVIHKDVKPSNILIEDRKDGAPAASPVTSIQVRLTDFGIGQLADPQALQRAGITATGFTETASAMTELSSRTGTRLYMAPELLAGRTPSIQSDIYSLGVLFYQQIIGDLSQPVATDWERQVPDLLLRDDLHRCIAGDPAERFSSADELAQRLRTLDQRRAALAAHEAAHRASMRRRRLAASLAVATGLLLLVAIALSYGLRREQVARRVAERESYYALIGVIDDCIEEMRFDRARELLAVCPRQHRYWEWGRLQYLCGQDLMTFWGHRGIVYSVAFSPDGSRLVAAGGDDTANLWDLQTGSRVSTFGGHKGTVYTVAFSPDGERIAMGSADGTAVVWDVKTMKDLLTLKGHASPVICVAFSPNGKRLATAEGMLERSTGRDSSVRIWDLGTGQELLNLSGHRGGVQSVAFNRDGKRLAAGMEDGTAKIWDLETSRALATLQGHGGRVCSVAFSPDNRRFATGSYDYTAKVWDVETWRELLTLKGTYYMRSVAFSPDGKRLATASDEMLVKLWDVQTGRELFGLKGHWRGVTSVAFGGPDGKLLATGSWDGTAKVWEVEQAPDVRTLAGHGGPVLSLAFDTSGKWVVTASWDGTVRFWHPQTGEQTRIFQGNGRRIYSIAADPKSRLLAIGCQDGTVRLLDGEKGEELSVFSAHPSPVTAIRFSPDGSQLATASGWRFASSGDQEAKVWDAKTGRLLRTLKGHQHQICSLAFGPDGKRLVTGSWDRTVRVWDAETGKELLKLLGARSYVYCVAFGPDGKRVAAGDRMGRVCVWDAKTGRELVAFDGAGRFVCSLAFSPDGKRLITGNGDKTARVWDPETGREILTLKGHGWSVSDMAFSPDGRLLATAGSFDQTAMIWDTLPWREEDLPGNSSMSYDERIRLYKLEQWKKRQQQEEGKR